MTQPARSPWRLLLDPPADGATNMARDAAILDAVAAGEAPPTLRLYTWDPPCLSLGAFQDPRGINLVACRERGIDVVRRPTGGAAVLHQHELTYAVIVPRGDPLAAGGVLATYRRIGAALRVGLERLGVRLDELARARAGSRDRATGACFRVTSSYELTAGGKKLVGSAQLRRRGALLQHGAILLDIDLDLHARIFPDGAALAARITTLRALLGEAPHSQRVADAIRSGFEEHGPSFWEGSWSAAEAAAARSLAEAWPAVEGRGRASWEGPGIGGELESRGAV